jgi:hypothetical protein
MGGHVACMVKVRNTKFWSENVKVRDHLEGLIVDGRLILEWWEVLDWFHVAPYRD